MAKYRKKPVIVEAYQFINDNLPSDKMPQWLKEALNTGQVVLWSQHGGTVLRGEIKTLEGMMEISENDYIIKGVAGEFYPCKPDIFEITYEKVEV